MIQYLAYCNIDAKTAESIAGVLSLNVQIQELDLSGNNLQSTGFVVICKALQQLSTLTKLFLANNNVTGNAHVAVSIAKVLSKNTQLKEIDLSENNLQSASFLLLCKALQKFSTLTKLFFSNNNNTTDDAFLAIYMAKALSHNTQLRELDLSGNNLKSAGCSAICRAFSGMSLTKLSLLNNNITYEAVDDIADLLSHNIQIQELQLQISNLTPIDCIKISHALRSTSSLLKLSIPNSNITSESADSIAAVLSHNTQLQELNLDGNCLEYLGTKQVFDGLKNTTTLHKLSIQDNHCTEDAARDIAHVVSHNIGLQELNLRGNDLQTAGIRMITKSLQSSSNKMILENCDT